MLDEVRTEVIRNAFGTLTEEMGVAVARASFSTMIQESVESSAALLDAAGRLVSTGQETTPLHGSSLRYGLRSIIEDFPPDAMADGDVFVMNDPYRGGIHSNDLLVLRPVFLDRDAPGQASVARPAATPGDAGGHSSASGTDPAFFTGTLVHVADLGGASSGGLPANVTDFFGEGLRLPPVKLYDAGREVPAVFSILEHNSRMPDNLLGDVRALVAGVNVGALRLRDLVDRFGAGTLLETTSALLEHSRRLVGEALHKIPEGRYEGSYRIEDDGSGNGREYVVRAALTVGGGRIAVDFAGTSDQANGIINAAYSQAVAATLFGVRACVGLTLPLDEGFFDSVDITLPYGSLVDPRPSAACNGRIVTCTAIVEAVVSALSAADSSLAMAASGMVHIYTLGGADAEGRQWGYLGVEMGGSGARSGLDGPDAVSAAMFGGGRTTSDVEPIEARYPVLFERSRLLPDSGGPGRWRGGLGTETVVRALTDAVVTVRTDRVRLTPPGLFGGGDGRAGGYAVRRADGRRRALPGKAMNVALHPGDALVMRTTGGGGVGAPARRSPERRAADLADRAVTPSRARLDYPEEAG